MHYNNNNIVRVILLLITFTSATIVDECDNVKFPLEVDIDNCEEQPCEFVLGKDVQMNLTFIAPYDIEKLTPEVWANLGITQVNYPLSEQNGCKSLVSGKCPIEKGQTAIYHMTMPIANSFPKVHLTLTFTLKDQNNKGIACFQTDAYLVDA